ncbi:hypothetical protein DL96DRAFT_235530 [Flagelloscypha sp. PMI_526]|nr:hypothetical protein DL96DRAFT_235530 [Flagelloscypha sp. PMI_526]
MNMLAEHLKKVLTPSVTLPRSAPFGSLPYDIREHIFKNAAWSVEGDERLALMLVSKDVYYLVSKVQYRTIFFLYSGTRTDRRLFPTVMKTRPRGFFQDRVQAFWIVRSLSSCFEFLENYIGTFQNLRHVAFNFSRGGNTQENLRDAIRTRSRP